MYEKMCVITKRDTLISDVRDRRLHCRHAIRPCYRRAIRRRSCLMIDRRPSRWKDDRNCP